MPSMANITVKKNDGTTDQVLTQQQPSAGDKSPAIWRNLSVGSAPAFNPEFRLVSVPNKDRTVRRLTPESSWPQVALGSDGVHRVINTARFTNGSFVYPQGMPSAEYNEFVSQTVNWLASTLVKDCLKSGFSAV